MEFFPAVEPDSAQLLVRARGDLSVEEKDAIVRKVERRLDGLTEVRALYARSFAAASSQQGADVIGVLQFQLIDWHQRRPARAILDDMQARVEDMPGVVLEFQEREQGPAAGKPVQLEISARDPALADEAVAQIREEMVRLGGFTGIEDNRSLPGVEWRLRVDREEAARFEADVTSIGSAVQMITTGLLLATYRPVDAIDEVDIRVRMPDAWRNLDQLQRLTLNTNRGQVPLSQFVQLEPAPKVGTLHRVDGRRAITLQADLAPGQQLDERLQALRPVLEDLPEGVMLSMAGEQMDQQETAQFLVSAFFVAIFMMLIILVTQFNNIFQAMLVLSAIVFSTAGILIGLLVNSQPFGVVMVGMGIIALAGIVVNNNIVLIDTYNEMRGQGMTPAEAALEAGSLRLRPVLLTAGTTVLGLLPMVLGINVNLFEPSLGLGAPSTQWWAQLSSAIAGGLAFASALTLLLTPCMLLLGAKVGEAFRKEFGSG